MNSNQIVSLPTNKNINTEMDSEKQFYREDGRSNDQIRSIRVDFDVLKEVDGSATFELGNTKVIASVFGPFEDQKATNSNQNATTTSNLNNSTNAGSNTSSNPSSCFNNQLSTSHTNLIITCQVSTAPFSQHEHRSGIQKRLRKNLEKSKAIESILNCAIQNQFYTNSRIDVQVQIMQSDGCELTACINAAALALIDAGIMLQQIPVACSMTKILPKTTLLKNKSAVKPISIIDPNYRELSHRNSLLFTLVKLGEKIIFIQFYNNQNQPTNPTELIDLYNFCSAGAEKTKNIINQALNLFTKKIAAIRFI